MSSLPQAYDVVFLNGTVGVGKTTTADALSDLERAANRVHAVVDLDQVRRLHPSPAGDPFSHEIELANLRDLARNYCATGAERLILAGVVEEADELPRYVEALQGSRLLLVRLTVDHAVAAERLRQRHGDETQGLAWHLARTVELSGTLDEAPFEDVRIDTTGRTPEAVARDVQRAAGWA